MLSSFRNRFGTAGLVVSIVALVAALAGGAYAASGALTAKQKKEVKSIAKSFQGTGPAGPAGAAGPQGPAGKDGANGSNGAAGPTGPTGNKGSNGSAGAVGETGPTGATGPTGTFGNIPLPQGVTEVGYWAFTTPGVKTIKDGDSLPVTVGQAVAYAPISFHTRLEEFTPSEYATRFQLTDPDFATTCGTGEGGAGGKAANPKAPPKTLCIWAFGGALENATFNGVNSSHIVKAGTLVNHTGAILEFIATAEGPASGSGSWALTN